MNPKGDNAREDERLMPGRRVLLAGDTHGNLRHVAYLFKIAAEMEARTIVQLGDFGYWPHLSNFDEQVNALAIRDDVDFFWLDGNHENFDALEKAVDFDAATPQQMRERLWYLPRGSTWEWDGCRFMAFGGAYSIDKAYRREGHSWWPQELPTQPQALRAMDRGPVDVLLTHDAPEQTCPVISDDYKGDEISRGNRKAISAITDAVQPRLLVHGHYHCCYATALRNIAVRGLDRDDSGPDSWLVMEPAAWSRAGITSEASA